MQFYGLLFLNCCDFFIRWVWMKTRWSIADVYRRFKMSHRDSFKKTKIIRHTWWSRSAVKTLKLTLTKVSFVFWSYTKLIQSQKAIMLTLACILARCVSINLKMTEVAACFVCLRMIQPLRTKNVLSLWASVQMLRRCFSVCSSSSSRNADDGYGSWL